MVKIINGVRYVQNGDELTKLDIGEQTTMQVETGRRFPDIRDFEDYGAPAGERIYLKRTNGRFPEQAQAERYFAQNYDVVCACHSARYWCVIVRGEKKGTK